MSWFHREPKDRGVSDVKISQNLLQASRLLQHKTTPTARQDCPRKNEIQPPDEERPVTVPADMLGVSEEAQLAVALETILQGKRVTPERFTQLYRAGYTFKEPTGHWAITEAGKRLIERHKIKLDTTVLVEGIPCGTQWKA